ncbi:MAG: hypothetical protein CVV24_02245 [Ignavibacteriae bacterium HGW-Ignavibacteriae-3]|nr:MAG: hypothetical protein CVV24_02245 [Ignavibacteriae bacterium HGW-Ignavibacteriae-3]
MKVSTNSIGNYQPSYIRTNAVTRNDAVQKTEKENISVEEKKFFAELYPGRRDEIAGYQSYNSKGKVSGVHVGSLFDRRG